MAGKYADILDLPRHRSPRRAAMTAADRAAQFAPFAALTGYDGVLAETGRQTESWRWLEEDRMALLNGLLQQLQRDIGRQPTVRILCYRPDARKQGGAYDVLTGAVRRLDEYRRELVFADGRAISIDTIFELELL